MVCVTGASGYIGSSLVMRLLQRGYHVRATVRDPGLYYSSLLYMETLVHHYLVWLVLTFLVYLRSLNNDIYTWVFFFFFAFKVLF